jgi:hypothetical protein
MQLDLALQLEKVLSQLRAERELLDQAISNLEGLAIQRKRSRGRPPGRSNLDAVARTRAVGADSDRLVLPD